MGDLTSEGKERWALKDCVEDFSVTENLSILLQENIGAMQITGVGSRIVIQVGAIIAVIFGLIGKFGGLFASMPQAMVAGLFCVMFALIGRVSASHRPQLWQVL